MVILVAEEAKVDKQGRLVLPSRVRRSLGLAEGGHISVRLDGSRVVIEVKSRDVEARVREWSANALKADSKAFVERREEGGKWMSDEYVRRKLGLP